MFFFSKEIEFSLKVHCINIFYQIYKLIFIFSYLHSPLRMKRSGDGSLWSLSDDGVDNKLNSFCDCSTKSEIGTQTPSLNASSNGTFTSSLPPWLQHYKEDNQKPSAKDQVTVFSLTHTIETEVAKAFSNAILNSNVFPTIYRSVFKQGISSPISIRHTKTGQFHSMRNTHAENILFGWLMLILIMNAQNQIQDSTHHRSTRSQGRHPF